MVNLTCFPLFLRKSTLIMYKVVCLLIISSAVYSCKPKTTATKASSVSFLTVKDKCGNSYNAIQIGGQKWMVDNLKTVRYSDNVFDNNHQPVSDSMRTLFPLDSSILYRSPIGKDGSSYYPDTLAYYWRYQGGISQRDFGRLYTWYAVKTRNVCPQGWHVPSESDWEKLITFLGGSEIAGGKLKSVDSTMWELPNVGANNSTNFTGVGGGYKTEFATFIDQLKFGMYWSATEDPDFNDCAFAYALYSGSIKTYKVSKSKKAGLSIRCVSDK